MSGDTSITTANQLAVGTIVIVNDEWMRVTGTVGNCTYFVTPLGWRERFLFRARNVARRARSVWRCRVWWPVADWVETRRGLHGGRRR